MNVKIPFWLIALLVLTLGAVIYFLVTGDTNGFGIPGLFAFIRGIFYAKSRGPDPRIEQADRAKESAVSEVAELVRETEARGESVSLASARVTDGSAKLEGLISEGEELARLTRESLSGTNSNTGQGSEGKK